MLQRWPKRIYLSVPHMGGNEARYVQEAFAQNWISTVGPNLDALEQQFRTYCNAPAVALSCGTAALHLGLKAVGMQPGDEVISPTLTFGGSVFPIMHGGGTPVFLDSDYATWNLDPNVLADFLKKRAVENLLPKFVIVVHLFGQCAEMDPILETCRKYGVCVVEDAAEALGATYKDRIPTTMGELGIFSFNGNKIITGSSGGMLVSRNEAFVEKARYWSTQARDKDPAGINNYQHSEVGYNYRMSNLIAGVVRGQMEVLAERVQQRRAVAFRYAEAFADLPGITLMPQASSGFHTNWLSCFLVDEKAFGISQADLIRFLETLNIESRPVWRPMHMQKLFERHEYFGGNVAETLNARGICLPSSSSMTMEEQDFVIAAVRSKARNTSK